MDYISILTTFGLPLTIGIIGWVAGRNKNKAETNKLCAETDFLYAQKYKEDLEATKEFREMLVTDNAALVKEIKDMKIKYEITTLSLKEQIAELTYQLEEIVADREYKKCNKSTCETQIAYDKIMASRAKRKANKIAKEKLK